MPIQFEAPGWNPLRETRQEAYDRLMKAAERHMNEVEAAAESSAVDLKLIRSVLSGNRDCAIVGCPCLCHHASEGDL